MPPKKKKRQANPKAELGIGRKHVMENFGELPEIQNIKNGHVIQIYLTVGGNKSRAATVRFLEERFLSVTLRSDLNACIKKVMDHYSKLHKLTENSEFSKLRDLCDEPFEISVTCRSQSPEEPSTPVATTSATPVACVSTTPLIWSTRSHDCNTPRKARLRHLLKFVTNQKKKYQAECTKLKASLKTPSKVINQCIKRKIGIIEKQNIKIRDLNRKLAAKEDDCDLRKTKVQLRKLQSAHKKLLKRKKNKSTMKTPDASSAEVEKLQTQLHEKVDTIRYLEDQTLSLEQSLEMTSKSTARSDGKSYSTAMRMKVFDCLVNHVPTANIPTLIKQLSKRDGHEKDCQDVPHRSTVEMMARELGAIAELQTAEVVMENKNCTLGFDATTQEGTHINEIHFTTKELCVCAAVEELSGGTAEDYASHISNTVNSMAQTYCYFNKMKSYQDVRSAIIDNISNTMSDRCAANHAALRLVASEWSKTLNELNCHLHPLDSIASATRGALKKQEESRGNLYGKECRAANIIQQMSKLRYKDGKGDPRGFTTFLDQKNLPRGILPRYRGNRLHILFHNAGILVEHHETFKELLRTGTSLGGLRADLLKDLQSEVGVTELQVLGLLGKHLTAPWMRKFYTSAENEINHIDGINVVQGVIEMLKDMMKDPLGILSAGKDFFNADLTVDSTLTKLRSLPISAMFVPMMKASLEATVVVLERQYQKYFELDITEKLREEAATSRSHNIDAEEIMGMFSAVQKRSPHATLCFISSKMRAIKNRTVDYLDDLTVERRDDILRKAVRLGREQRQQRRISQKSLRAELIKRQQDKVQQKEMTDRRKLERLLKKSGLEGVKKDFPHLNHSEGSRVNDILSGRIVGLRMCHVWLEDAEKVVYNGLIRKLYANNKYKVSYWKAEEDFDDATDYHLSMYELASDLLCEDLIFSD